ncbi:MAG: hypothetical protein J0L88_04165 [Xanthomonadales bacterium]|nr:hypothetical protein [Xanthomonadales bacterium]
MRGMKYVLAIGGMIGASAAGAAPAAFDWLAGHWCGGEDGRVIEEVWLPEAGGALLGMSRTIRDGKVETFEFMRIVVDGDRATFHVQPNGVPATLFTMATRDAGSIRFENPAHDFPNRIEYRRNGERLEAAIAGPGRDGRTMTIPFAYRRCGA